MKNLLEFIYLPVVNNLLPKTHLDGKVKRNVKRKIRRERSL